MEGMGVDPSWTDPLTGSWEAFIVQAALFYRGQSGKGICVDLSMLESAIIMMGDVFLQATTAPGNAAHEPSSGYAHAVPHGIYPCAGDDAWIAISVESDAEWEKFCQALGRPQWMSDGTLKTIAGRQKARALIDSNVAAWTSSQSPDAMFHRLQEAGVRAGPCANFEQVMKDPQMVCRGLFQPIEMKGGRRAMTAGMPWTDESGWKGTLNRAPDLGEDNDYVFKELLGMSEADYEDNRKAGIIE